MTSRENISESESTKRLEIGAALPKVPKILQIEK